MNSITIIVFALFVCAAIAAEDYTKKYDNVNIETVLSNDRVLTNYINCLLGKGACTREGRELKSKFYMYFLGRGNLVYFHLNLFKKTDENCECKK